MVERERARILASLSLVLLATQTVCVACHCARPKSNEVNISAWALHLAHKPVFRCGSREEKAKEHVQHVLCLHLPADPLSTICNRGGASQGLLSHHRLCPAGVAIYNYYKLQLIRAKAKLSTSKDAEKGGGGAPPGQIANATSLPLSDGGASANGRKEGYDSSYRYAQRLYCNEVLHRTGVVRSQ